MGQHIKYTILFCFYFHIILGPIESRHLGISFNSSDHLLAILTETWNNILVITFVRRLIPVCPVDFGMAAGLQDTKKKKTHLTLTEYIDTSCDIENTNEILNKYVKYQYMKTICWSHNLPPSPLLASNDSLSQGLERAAL